jgi:hypothetical protein
MLVLSRRDLAINLASYGEHEASARIGEMPEAAYERVCQIGFKHALTGMHLFKAGCLAAIEVMEGAPRELKRQRRDWNDVPTTLREPDPKVVEIHQRFDRYAGGQRILKKEIVDGVAQTISPALRGFRYHKTSQQFRGPFCDGTAYVDVDYAKGMVALRFGVWHEKIESLKRRLFGVDNSKPPHFPSTISKYSYNMGPLSPHWPYPTEVTWPISGTEGLALACGEIETFVLETVVPYVMTHREPIAIRSTFIYDPGRADTWFPIDATVFAIDFLCRKREWVTQDYDVLRQRFAKFPEERKQELEARHATTMARWNEAI